MVALRMRHEVLAWVLGLVLLGVTHTASRAQITSFEQAVTMNQATVQGVVGSAAPVVITSRTQRLATLEELSTFAAGDLNSNSIPDGNDPAALAALFPAYPDPVALYDAFFAENDAKGLYPVEPLLAILSSVGFPAEQVDSWRQDWGCGKDVRKRCRERCVEANREHPCSPRCRHDCRRRRQRPHALAECLEDCREIPDCPPKPKGGKPKGHSHGHGGHGHDGHGGSR